MRIALIVLMIVAFAVPVHARGGKRQSPDASSSTAEKQKKSRAEEKAYKDSLGRIPNQKPADPWAKVR